MLMMIATYKSLPPFAATYGPHDARIVIVGEAFGSEEEKLQRPFVGPVGAELTRMLQEAGIERSKCLLTNVLALKPPDTSRRNNDLDALCVPRGEVGREYIRPPLSTGKYLKWEYLSELDRLRDELLVCRPNIILALGNLASWALLNSTGITKLRGTVNYSTLIPELKVLPTFHPSYILRQWNDRVVVIADLMKAKREAEFPEIRRPARWIVVNPTFTDIEQWYEEHARKAKLLAVDIETFRGQIRSIGFASSASQALVIPLIDFTRLGNHYWPTLQDELLACDWIQKFLALPCGKIFQNGMYDLQYLLKAGYKPINCAEDTMLLHHSLFPELMKGLGFLGSVYTNESAWKLMRLEKREEFKADE